MTNKAAIPVTKNVCIVGKINGKIILKNSRKGFAPSSFAASITDGSIPFIAPEYISTCVPKLIHTLKKSIVPNSVAALLSSKPLPIPQIRSLNPVTKYLYIVTVTAADKMDGANSKTRNTPEPKPFLNMYNEKINEKLTPTNVITKKEITEFFIAIQKPPSPDSI